MYLNYTCKRTVLLGLLLLNYPASAFRQHYTHLWGLNCTWQLLLATLLSKLKFPKKVNLSNDELHTFKTTQPRNFRLVEGALSQPVDSFIKETMKEFKHPCADKAHILLADGPPFAIDAFNNVFYVDQHEAGLLTALLQKKNLSLIDQENLYRIKAFIGHEVGHYMGDTVHDMYHFHKVRAFTQMACLLGWSYCFYKLHGARSTHIKRVSDLLYATLVGASTVGTQKIHSYAGEIIERKLEENADRYMFDHAQDEKYIVAFKNHFQMQAPAQQDRLSNGMFHGPLLRGIHRLTHWQEPFDKWFSRQTTLKKAAYFMRGAKHPMDEDRAFAAHAFLLEKNRALLEKMAQDNQ